MNPAFDLLGRNITDLETLLALLNRDEARTRTVTTRIGDQTRIAYDRYLWFQGPPLSDPVTAFYAIHYPFEGGTIFRRAQMIPATDLARTTGALGYITVAVGIRSADKFDVLGTEFDSRTRALSEGVVFTLAEEDVRIPDGAGLAVRVVQGGWPAATLEESMVETFLGYVGAT
jgi:hypothetical protein